MKSWSLMILVSLGAFLVLGCTAHTRDMHLLKQELKQEILAELHREGCLSAGTSASNASSDTPEPIRSEIETEAESGFPTTLQTPEQNRSRSAPSKSSPTGRAEGHILQNGQGLQGCKVKLVRILKRHSVFALVSVARDPVEFATVTDDQGKYVFDEIPTGAYKLRWQLPLDTGWIRRLKDRPDAVIAPGQTAVITAVETSHRLVSQ